MALNIFDIAVSQGIDPALYYEMQPFIQQMVGRYGAGQNLTEADIRRMTDETVARGRRRGLPSTVRGGMSLNDAVLILILLNLINYGYDVTPFWQFGIPFFLLPFLRGRRPPSGRPIPPIAGPRPPGGRPLPPIAGPRPPSGRPRW